MRLFISISLSVYIYYFVLGTIQWIFQRCFNGSFAFSRKMLTPKVYFAVLRRVIRGGEAFRVPPQSALRTGVTEKSSEQRSFRWRREKRTTTFMCVPKIKCWPYEIFKREKRWGTGRSICLQQDVNKRFIYVLVECVARCYSASTDAVDRCRVFSWRPQASSRLVPWCSWQQVTFLTKFNGIT